MSKRQVPVRHVRPISPADTDLMLDLHLQVFGVKANRPLLTDAMFGENSRAYCLQDASTKELLGFVLCKLLGPVVCVDGIGVRPDVQRLRIGSDLLEHVIRKADVEEINVVTYLPACNVVANAFFRSHGFKCRLIERGRYQFGKEKIDSLRFVRSVPEVAK